MYYWFIIRNFTFWGRWLKPVSHFSI